MKAGSIKKTPVLVVDASVLLSFLLPDEKLSGKFIKYLKLFEDGKVILKSAELLKYEVANGLKSAVKQKRIIGSVAMKLYEKFLMMEIKYEKIDFQKVLEVAIEEDITPYDASYLHLAQANKCELLTLDAKLKQISKTLVLQ